MNEIPPADGAEFSLSKETRNWNLVQTLVDQSGIMVRFGEQSRSPSVTRKE